MRAVYENKMLLRALRATMNSTIGFETALFLVSSEAGLSTEKEQELRDLHHEIVCNAVGGLSPRRSSSSG